MQRYNNIKYTYKQAKRMLYVHKGKLQMGLPEWDEGHSIRVYIIPNIKDAIYSSYRVLNPELPKEELYLPDDMYLNLQRIGVLTKNALGDMMTNNFLYKHRVHSYSFNERVEVTVYNEPWTPTLKESKRRDWILYKL